MPAHTNDRKHKLCASTSQIVTDLSSQNGLRVPFAHRRQPNPRERYMLYLALIVAAAVGALIAWEISSAYYEKRAAQDANGQVSRDEHGRFKSAK
jgi:hypothetical protein